MRCTLGATYTFTNARTNGLGHLVLHRLGRRRPGDLIVGRLSVANRKDADAVVDKILDYAGQGPTPHSQAGLGGRGSVTSR